MKFETFIRQNARVNDATAKRYADVARSFAGWVGTRPLNPDTVQESERWLRTRYGANSLASNVTTAVNLWLRWKGHPELQVRRPPKEYNPRPRTIADKEYRELIARIADPMERLAVRLSHDAGWSPSDIVQIRKADMDLGDVAVIRKVRQKTRVVAEAVLEKETAAELRAYLEAHPDADYLFPGDRRKGEPHRNRTWVNAVLKAHGATFTPRVFRSNLATAWPGDDIKGLMKQGGWTDPKTIFAHYRGNLRERQVDSFEAAMGRPAKDRDPEAELPGYG
jgi:integrase